MKQLTSILLIFTVFLSCQGFAQPSISGEYDSNLRLAFDPLTNIVTGYYENYSGFDSRTNKPSFSCIYYIKGTYVNNKININTYNVVDSKLKPIKGILTIEPEEKLTIQLNEEHDGCWNVAKFKDEAMIFFQMTKEKWEGIHYVTVPKAYIYKAKTNASITKSFLVKNNFICIEKYESGWAFGTFYGKKPIKGWMKITDLNNFISL